MFRILLLFGIVCAKLQEPVSVKAHWRFEDTIPSAYWRHENIYTDHSGQSNHLGFFEPNGIATAFNNTIDGNPQAANCHSNVGLGCTYLEYRGIQKSSNSSFGYNTDKSGRTDWVSYGGVFQSSHDVPPIHMFNPRLVKPDTTITVRQSIFEVSYEKMPGIGRMSFYPGEIPSNSTAYLAFSTSEPTSPLVFESGFTLEGFFKTEGNQNDAGPMIILHQQNGLFWSYQVGLNLDQPGSITFQLGLDPYPNITIHEWNVTNGIWHYFVARYDRESSGTGSEGKLFLKVMDEMNSTASAVSSSPVGFQVSQSNDQLFVGSYMDGENRFLGKLDELRISQGLLIEEDLLGRAGVDYSFDPGQPACSGRVTLIDQMGTFGDLSPGEYVNNLSCEWLIQPQNHTKPQDFIVLRFNRFETEIDRDIVVIYDGDSLDSPILATLSGYDVPRIPIISTSGKMLVRFTSDVVQNSFQGGFEAEYMSMSLSEQKCSTANVGHHVNLTCTPGYIIKKVNFASYGTPLGFCSNADPESGKLKDPSGHIYADTSNPNGLSDGVLAGEGAGGQDGPIPFATGFCHHNESKLIVESLCLDKSSCDIHAVDEVFGGNPCVNLTDSKIGRRGVDDPNVLGIDPYPQTDIPYFGDIKKRLYVLVTCEGQASFASNCVSECSVHGRCLYALTYPFCDWCDKTQLGLNRQPDGIYFGEGCGSKFCVKEATCTPIP